MSLSIAARRGLIHGLKSAAAGKNVADVVDAGSGTLSGDTRRRVQFMATNKVLGGTLCDKIDAGEALSGAEQARLGLIMNSRVHAAEVAAALAE